MTVAVVFAEPPRPGLVLPEMAATSPLSAEEAADLYAAMLKDTLVAVESSGNDLLVNFLSDDDLPAAHRTDTDVQAAVRALAVDALSDVADVRFEPQVGSTFDARAGNTVTHLLREEGASAVAVLRGNAPLLARTTIDSAVMKLRRAPVVLGPAPSGRVHFAAFAETIDFSEAFAPPAVATLVDHAADAGHDAEFIEMTPVVESGVDLVTLLSLLRARRTAGRAVPEHTAALVDDLGLTVGEENGEAALVRG